MTDGATRYSRNDDTDPFRRKPGQNASVSKLFDYDDHLGMSYRWVMQLAGDSKMMRPFAQHPWVNACVNAIAKSVSSVPLRISKKTDQGTQVVSEGPLYRLLEKPNAIMSQRKFLRSIAQTQQLYGETFLILMKRDGSTIRPIQPSDRIQVPDELWPVRGDLVEEVIDPNTNLPKEWIVHTGADIQRFDHRQVIQIAEANPYNPLRGMGPMQAAYRTAAKDFITERYDEALLQNGGSPGGILTVDGHLTDADQRAIREAWREAHERPDSHRKTAVLPQGTTYKEIGFSPHDMEFAKMREWDRETIMSVFGVTKPIIGLTEGLNFASSTSAFRVFWEVTVIPFLEFLVDEIRVKFLHRLVGVESTYDIYFDLDGVAALREDIDSKVDRTIKLFAQGGRSFDEAAKLAGWEIDPVEDGDDRFMPVNMTPADMVGQEESEPESEEEDPIQSLIDEGDEPDDEEEDERLRSKAVDPERRDEVYKKWRATVNMSASELESWSKNPCSRKASLNPAAVIARNLRLLRKSKASWDARDVRDANRTINFVSRMRGMPRGKPAVKGCPSKRDISLKNWAYNPSKGSKSLEESPDETVWPEGLKTREERLAYLKAADAVFDLSESAVQRRINRVLRDLMLHIRKRLNTVAQKSVDTAGIRKSVFTESEIQRLLAINEEEWEQLLWEESSSKIAEAVVAGAYALHLDLGGTIATFTTDVTDPVIVEYLASKELKLKGVTKTLIDEVQRNIVKILSSSDSQYADIREAVFYTLDRSNEYVNETLMKTGTRAGNIARTEVTSAHNYGRHITMIEQGIGSSIWLSQPDARESHQDLNGREVPIGEVFGYQLRYPGDPQAPAEQVCNCRCVVLAGNKRIETNEQ